MPDPQPSVVSGALRRPFAEQVAYFRGKLGNQVPTARWDDLSKSQHDTAFIVAGAQKAELLADLAASVDRAVIEGKSLDAFRKDFAAAVAKNDWHGWTGEDSRGGRAWRTRTIYRTNASVSYAAGRLAQLKAANFKYWVYRHGNSKEPRPQHLDWNGVALPPDHPFWEQHYPPSDWGCSCYVVGTNSIAGIRRLGGDPDKKLPDNWQEIDPKTGEPVGIGKGWGYAPGATVVPAVQAAAGKIGAWDYQIGKAFMASLPAEQRDLLSSAYRNLPSVADDVRRFAQRVLNPDAPAPDTEIKTLGMLNSDQVDSIGPMVGQNLQGYDFSIARSDIGHVDNRHGPATETTPGQRPVTTADYARLPQIIDNPDVVRKEGVSDMGEQLVRLERVIDGERYVAIFAARGAKRRTLALKTFFIQSDKG